MAAAVQAIVKPHQLLQQLTVNGRYEKLTASLIVRMWHSRLADNAATHCTKNATHFTAVLCYED